MKNNLFLCKISGNEQQLSTIIMIAYSYKISSVRKKLKTIFYQCQFFAILILYSFFLNYSNVLSYLGEFLCYEYLEIAIRRLKNTKNYLFSLFVPPIFYKKRLKNTYISIKTAKQLSFPHPIATIVNIINVLLVIIIIKKFETLDNLEQHMKISNIIGIIMKKNYIVPLLWLSDINRICGVSVGCESESIDQGRSYVDKTINISRCFFSRFLSYSGNGGVIYVWGGSYSMNLNSSMFYNCVCSNQGGAIYTYFSNSFLRMICVNRCSASSHHFAYLKASLVNQVEYLSVSNCSHTTSGHYSIRLDSGDQSVDNTNSSMNNAIQGSGILISSPSIFTSSYCTFSNNKVSDYICIWFYSDFGIISMSCANIVHDNSPSAYAVVLVEGGGSKKMMYCIFQQNQNYLFCVGSGSLELSHSFIDHSESSFSIATAVSTTNNSLTNRVTYQIPFFNSHHCNTDILLTEPKQMITIDQKYTKSILFLYTVIILMIS